MLQFGTCTWTLGLSNANDIFAKCAELGLQHAQFHGSEEMYGVQPVIDAAARHDVNIYCVDPFDCKPPSADQASPENGISFYKRAINYAEKLGVNRVTIHGISTWVAPAVAESELFDTLVNACKTLCDYAAERNITVLYELCNQYEVPVLRRVTEWEALFLQVDRANFQLILDSFHMNMEEPDPLVAISQCTALAMYHISDSNRAGIDSGNINFSEQFAALAKRGYHAPVMLELVLPTLTPNTPPANEQQWQALEAEFATSMTRWREFASQVN